MTPSAKDQRREDLYQSLNKQLSERNNLPPRKRLIWLCEQMQEYVGRWLGFCAVPSLKMQSLLGSDFFTAIEVGSDILDKELGQADVSREVRIVWSDFCSSLNTLKSRGEKRGIDDLMPLLNALHSALKE